MQRVTGPKISPVRNPCANGARTKRVLGAHKELYAKTGYKPLNPPVKF